MTTQQCVQERDVFHLHSNGEQHWRKPGVFTLLNTLHVTSGSASDKPPPGSNTKHSAVET